MPLPAGLRPDQGVAIGWRTVLIIAAALGSITTVIAVLERIGLDDASAVYLLAVVAVAVAVGTTPPEVRDPYPVGRGD